MTTTLRESQFLIFPGNLSRARPHPDHRATRQVQHRRCVGQPRPTEADPVGDSPAAGRLARLPEFESVPFGIGRPAEAAVAVVLDAVVQLGPGSAELGEHRIEVLDSKVEHPGLS